MSNDNFTPEELAVLAQHGLAEERWADGMLVPTASRQEIWNLAKRYKDVAALFNRQPQGPGASAEAESDAATRARYPTMFEK